MIAMLRAALIALLVLSVVPAAEGAAPSPELVLAGIVSDGAGRPVSGAHVVVVGERRTTVVTGHDGDFRVRAPLPGIERLRAVPCTLQVFVTAKKLRVMLPRGDASLTMALSIESSPDHGERAVVRANDERVAAIVAGLAAAGRGVAIADSVRFLALDGERVGDPPLAKMPHMVQVAMATTIPEPAPAARETVLTPPGVAYHAPIPPIPTGLEAASRPAAPVESPKPTAAKSPATTAAKPKVTAADPPPKNNPTSSGSKSKTAAKAATPVKVTVSDGAAAETRPTSPAAGSCACRIKGTVELMMDPPPTEPVGVAIWAEDYPALRDSVVLALGPPRPFELVGLPCGSHHLLVRSSSRRPYVIAEPRDMTLPCGGGQLLQPRIVLRPR